jgi:hypothetical protein
MKASRKIHTDCVKSFSKDSPALSPLLLASYMNVVALVASDPCRPLYFWFAQFNFVLVRSAVFACLSAHSNPTGVAAQRRTDFVLV